MTQGWAVRATITILVAVALLPAWPTAARADGAAGHLSGVVRNASGEVQANAEVVLADPSGATIATDTTGSGGRYSFTVSPVRYDLGVVTRSPVERVARVRGIEVGPDTNLDVIVLPPYIRLSGTIRDASGAPVRLSGRVWFGGEWSEIDRQTGQYSLWTRPGTSSLSINVTDDNTSTWLEARVDAFTLTDDRVQDLTFPVTPLTIDGRDRRGQPVAVAAANVYSPFDCTCPARFEFFPGSGQATGVWRSFRHGGTVLALPGDLIVTAAPADPGLLQVTAKPVSAPWPNPLPVVFDDVPPPSETPPPPATVTWTGTVRHNGVPVPEVDLSVSDDGLGGWAETDDDGRFELHLTPGHKRLDLSAYIGSAYADDSGGPPPGLHLEVPDFEITEDRTMDIDIPTVELTVHVVDEVGRPVPGALVTAGASYWQGPSTPVEIFPGGRGEGSLSNYLYADAAGDTSVLMFPGAPPLVSASAGYAGGSVRPAPSDRSVTVQIRDETKVLSGMIRDARGPLPVVNWPWVSFSGPASRYEEFEGDHLGPTGAYELHAAAGKHQLIISDQPDFDEDDTDHHVATATLPEVWTITTAVDLPESRTLDLTIPDAAPARFRMVDSDGKPQASGFSMTSTHRVDLGSGITGDATAETNEANPQGTFQHLLFGPARVSGQVSYDNGWNDGRAYPFSLRVTPGDDFVLAVSSDYDGGDIMPPVTTTTTAPPPTSTTTTQPQSAQPNPGTSTTSNAAKSGYWALSSDGTVYNFGEAPQLGNSAASAVDLEPTPTGNGYWTLNRNGTVQAFGDAAKHGDVDMTKLAKGEDLASLSATPSGEGYWVFTNRGRAIAFGDAPFLGDVSTVKLNGPVLGSVATPSGRGYYMVASDGGIFAFGEAAFAGSMGGKKLNAPVQSLVPDGDSHGYWLVASDGGIFAFDAPFHGSMGGTKLNKPISGMVRYGDGYLMVGADGGIFNFSSTPFAGSLGNKPPTHPVVAVAALP